MRVSCAALASGAMNALTAKLAREIGLSRQRYSLPLAMYAEQKMLVSWQ